jgi:hypothetical protein
MKKNIIVFALSIILSVIGICLTIAYLEGMWSQPVSAEEELVPGISSITALTISVMGFISALFTATALIFIIYCIKFCTGIMRVASIVLCVLCVSALTLSVLSYTFNLYISKNLTSSLILVRLCFL